MRAITINYSYSGYRGQFFANGSTGSAINALHSIGASSGRGVIKPSSGICGKFYFNFILN